MLLSSLDDFIQVAVNHKAHHQAEASRDALRAYKAAGWVSTLSCFRRQTQIIFVVQKQFFDVCACTYLFAINVSVPSDKSAPAPAK